MKPAPGDVIGGKYRIVRLIGDGGMGTVYEAHHEFLETSVALKFLHTELAQRAGLGSRFLQEARVSARIRSPHVTHVTDVDQTADGSPYLVMELLHGEPLQQAMDRRGKLPPEQAVDFALQILSGLESAHAIGVVHRDLKPDNVFIVPATGGPLLKLIDFGIAKLRASTEFQKGLTRAGVIMGTPEYMAPEQLFAAENVDHRADLYSLGVILFEMLSGRRPADGDDVETIVASVVSGNVRHLASLEPGLPPGLIAVVERALKPDRDARFGSALEMRLALAPFAGALSYAGRLAASPEPVLHQQASHQPPQVQAMPAVQSAATGMAQAFDAERSLPKTLPPDMDPGTLNFSARSAPKGSTQEVSDEAVREAMRASALPGNLPPGNYGYGPPPAQGGTGAGATRRRKSRTGLWVGLSLLILLGLGGAALAAVFYQQHQPSTYAPPLLLDTPTPETTVNPLIDAGASGQVQPSPTISPITPGRPSLPTGSPTTAPTIIRPADAGSPAATADAGRNTFPFPFPLPSTLPPLPSTFPPLPKTFPTAFPSTLPPGFPQIPGFPFGAAPAAKRDGGK
ncbi:MAG: protein kinase [Myxococcales bacterium]